MSCGATAPVRKASGDVPQLLVAEDRRGDLASVHPGHVQVADDELRLLFAGWPHGATIPLTYHPVPDIA